MKRQKIIDALKEYTAAWEVEPEGKKADVYARQLAHMTGAALGQIEELEGETKRLRTIHEEKRYASTLELREEVAELERVKKANAKYINTLEKRWNRCRSENSRTETKAKRLGQLVNAMAKRLESMGPTEEAKAYRQHTEENK